MSLDKQLPCEMAPDSQVNTVFFLKESCMTVTLCMPELSFYQFIQVLLATPQSVACAMNSILVSD
jgi:hypothetical protein